MNVKTNNWKKSEIKILEENVGKIPTCKITELLPNRTLSSIYHKSDKMGLCADKSLGHRKYIYDYSFFDKPNLLNSYWAGFIAADGSILDYSNTVQISLHSKDEDHLIKFKKDVGFTGNLCEHKNHKSNRTTISVSHANRWIKKLEDNFNIGPRKTLVLKPPFLNIMNSLSYIVGYFDGDGTVTYCRPRYKDTRYKYLSIGFVGTFDVLNWIKGIFEYLFEFEYECNICKATNKNAYYYYIRGKMARKIYKSLMKLNVPKMKRKWNVKYK